MHAKEQTDLRGAPSMPVPVTAIYLAVMVCVPQPRPARNKYHASPCFSTSSLFSVCSQ